MISLDNQILLKLKLSLLAIELYSFLPNSNWWLFELGLFAVDEDDAKEYNRSLALIELVDKESLNNSQSH